MKKILTLTMAISMLLSCKSEKKLFLNLEEGKEYKQLTEAKANIVQNLNGQEMNMTMTIKGGVSYLVLSKDDIGYDMEVKYENLSMTMELPQGEMEFSSEKNDVQDMMSSILSEMKNKPFNVKMTKLGKIVEVKNIEALFESVFKKFPDIPEGQIAQIKTQLLNAYGEEAFKGNFEMVTAIYPEKSVSVGDNWIIDTKLESGMAADMATTYTFIESTSDYILINGNSKIETTDKDAYIESNGMPLKYDLTGTMVSDIKIDPSTGWIKEAKINQEIKGDAYIKGNPQMPDGIKIPMIMKNDMIVKGS